MWSYNIKFPLQDDNTTNRYFLMNSVTKDAYVSDLFLLLLTQKGERYYEPDYGTNLVKYLFQPNDNITILDIESDLKETVKKYIPSLTITSISLNQTDEAGKAIPEEQVQLTVNFVYSEGAFSQTGQLELTF
jgi:phage baseplate assembly protein W